MNSMNKIVGILLLATLLLNCGGSEKQVSQYQDPKVEELIADATDLDYLIGSEQILRNSSDRDKLQLQSALNAIKVNLAILDESPDNSAALQRLNTAIEDYETLIITERDKERIRPVFDEAVRLLAKFAKIQKTELPNIRWSVFSYRFSDGLGDFTNVIDNNNWKVRYVQQERYLANFGSGKIITAAMVSPIYDFSDVKNVAYSMRHNIGVEDDPKDQATRSQIMNNTFKIMVSTTYKKGDKFDISKFKRLPMGVLPTGLNFDTVDTGIIPLNDYSGKKNVTFAIVYDQQYKLERFSYISWSIERFNIYGLSGKKLPYVSAYIPPLPSSLEYNFGTDGFSKLQQITVDGTPDEFVEGDHNGTKFIKMQNQNARGTKLMFSAPIDISALKKPAIQFEHTINFYEGEAKANKDVRMVVAEYKEGVNPLELDWKTLDFKKGPTGDSWDVFKTEDLLLPSELIGKVIRLGWSHTSRNGSTPVWQMISTNIKDLLGNAPSVNFLEEDIVLDGQAGDDADADVPAEAITYTYDFGTEGLSELNQVTLAGGPADFVEGEHAGNAFVKMQARDVVGTKLLYSNVIDLKDNAEPSVQLVHTINFYKGEAKEQDDIKALIAIEQPGVAAQDLTWEVLNFQEGPDGSSWDILSSEDYILPKAYKGKKIRLAWSHTSRETSTPVWQLISVNIKDQSKIGE